MTLFARRFIHSLLLIGLLAGMVPTPVQSSTTPSVPADCALCGHECCCPDECAAILKSQKKNEERCQQTVTLCGMEPASQDYSFAAVSVAERLDLSPRTIATEKISCHHSGTLTRSQNTAHSTTGFHNVLTPPPRFT